LVPVFASTSAARGLLSAALLTGCAESLPLANPAPPSPPAAPESAIRISASGGASLGGFFGNFVTGVPEVTVSDRAGHPLAGVAVNFSAQGGGTLTGGSALTDSAGRAAPTSWRLGPSGEQSVSAAVAGAVPVLFTALAEAAPPGAFQLEIRYGPGLPPSTAQRSAFDAAAARWSRVILAGGAPYPIQEVLQGCGDIRGETVAGLAVMVVLAPMDGPGGKLGAAGPCILRDAGLLPAQGYVQLDDADLAALEARGQLADVILHEIGHALGFGTLWEPESLLDSTNASDPVFTGAASRAALYGLAGALGFSGTPVPVEATGSPGTALHHWREATFEAELMTGWIDAGANPMSALTIAQFRDLGYLVDDALGESYSFAAQLQAAGSAPLPLLEGALSMPLLVIDRRGHAVRTIRRVYR
jgi:hypothetical protein